VIALRRGRLIGGCAEGDDISLDGRPVPDAYQPLGLIYTLPIRAPSACAIESIGPDLT